GQEPSVLNSRMLQLTCLPSIQPEAGDQSILQLRKSSCVQIDPVVEQSDAAAYYRPAIAYWTECKCQSWREIVFVCDCVAIQTNAILHRQAIFDGPLVLK